MQVIRRKPGQKRLVLKWVSLQLNGKLPLSPGVRTQRDTGGEGRNGLQDVRIFGVTTGISVRRS